MKKANYSLLIMILRGVVGFFGLIAFFLMFGEQIKGKFGGAFKIDEVIGGSFAMNGNCLSLIGYILIVLAALATICLIFAKKLFNLDTKLIKILDFVTGGVFVVGGLLVVLTICWLAASNPKLELLDNMTLRSAPVVACVFASLCGCANIATGLFLEDK